MPASDRAPVDLAPFRDAARWKWPEYAFWLLPVAAWFFFPDNLSLLSQIAITALFAISLDLILGYAGIVSLGHAAFFGIGAYTAGLLPCTAFTSRCRVCSPRPRRRPSPVIW